MSALPLFDLLFSLSGRGPTSADPAASERAARWAAQLIQESLAEIGHLQDMDKDLGNSSRSTTFDRQAAALLQGAYEDWARRGEALLGRVTRVEGRGTRVEGSQQLRDELGRVSAMLRVTLDDLDEAAEQVRRGEVFTLDEVRRELLARNRN